MPEIQNGPVGQGVAPGESFRSVSLPQRVLDYTKQHSTQLDPLEEPADIHAQFLTKDVNSGAADIQHPLFGTGASSAEIAEYDGAVTCVEAWIDQYFAFREAKEKRRQAKRKRKPALTEIEPQIATTVSSST